MTRRSRHPGLTLLETLAVMILFAAATVATLGVLSSVVAGTRIRAAETAVRGAYERARALAVEKGGASLRVADGSFNETDGNLSDRTVRLVMPDGWDARFTDAETRRAIGALAFDGRGRTVDAVLDIARTSSPRSTLAVWRVHGLTGQFVEIERGAR